MPSSEMLQYYLSLRKPDASESETAAWKHMVYAAAHQETFWTHYREAEDHRLKMMRGDSGHGHGFLQIDDRWHFMPIEEEGVGWNLVENLVYGLEILYSGWHRAPDESCVDEATDWEARARASWSAYNGGPAQICRWREAADSRDSAYFEKWLGRGWLDWVENMDAPSPRDAACLIEGNLDCPAQISGSWQTRRLALPEGQACAFDGERLHCVERPGDIACLAKHRPISMNQTVALEASELSGLEIEWHDREGLCQEAIAGLHLPGQKVQVQQGTSLEKNPLGSVIGILPAGSWVQIIDFQLYSAQSQHRYYYVDYQGRQGWIYGGDRYKHDSMLSLPASEQISP